MARKRRRRQNFDALLRKDILEVLKQRSIFGETTKDLLEGFGYASIVRKDDFERAILRLLKERKIVWSDVDTLSLMQ